MKCPHCLENFHAHFFEGDVQAHTGAKIVSIDPYGIWTYRATQCPACERIIVFLLIKGPHGDEIKEMQVWPKGIARALLPPEVPEEYAADYREACLVLGDSPKASAALSRRCLQHVLRDKAGVRTSDLADEIQQVLDSKSLPTHLAEAIDAVRNIGNFAAHPIKSKSTGEIVEVQPGEAEWLLDTLEGLFDFYFVQPAVLKRKRDALNEKLSKTGKPPMK